MERRLDMLQRHRHFVSFYRRCWATKEGELVKERQRQKFQRRAEKAISTGERVEAACEGTKSGKAILTFAGVDRAVLATDRNVYLCERGPLGGLTVLAQWRRGDAKAELSGTHLDLGEGRSIYVGPLQKRAAQEVVDLANRAPAAAA
jgi:hypothetical protein